MAFFHTPLKPVKIQVKLDIRGRIVEARAHGDTLRDIASRFGLSKSSVDNICKKFQRSGSVSRKEGSGRPRKTSHRDDLYLISLIKRDPNVTSKDLKQYSGLPIYCSTIRRRISEKSDYGSHFQISKPFISAKNRRIRVAWCKERIKWTIQQ